MASIASPPLTGDELRQVETQYTFLCHQCAQQRLQELRTQNPALAAEIAALLQQDGQGLNPEQQRRVRDFNAQVHQLAERRLCELATRDPLIKRYLEYRRGDSLVVDDSRQKQAVYLSQLLGYAVSLLNQQPQAVYEHLMAQHNKNLASDPPCSPIDSLSQLRTVFGYLLLAYHATSNKPMTVEIEKLYTTFLTANRFPISPLFTTPAQQSQMYNDVVAFLGSRLSMPATNISVGNSSAIQADHVEVLTQSFRLLPPGTPFTNTCLGFVLLCPHTQKALISVLLNLHTLPAETVAEIRRTFYEYIFFLKRATVNVYIGAPYDLYLRLDASPNGYPSQSVFACLRSLSIDTRYIQGICVEISNTLLPLLQGNAYPDRESLLLGLENLRRRYLYDPSYNVYRPMLDRGLFPPTDSAFESYKVYFSEFIVSGPEQAGRLGGARVNSLPVQNTEYTKHATQYMHLQSHFDHLMHRHNESSARLAHMKEEYNQIYSIYITHPEGNPERDAYESRGRAILDKIAAIQQELAELQQPISNAYIQLQQLSQVMSQLRDMSWTKSYTRVHQDANVPLRRRGLEGVPATGGGSAADTSYTETDTTESSAPTLTDRPASSTSADDNTIDPDVEDYEESVIECVLDCKRIPTRLAWMYTPSLLIRPEVDQSLIGKYDYLLPRNISRVGQSDGGLATVRIDFLYDDLRNVNDIIELDTGGSKARQSAPATKQPQHISLANIDPLENGVPLTSKLSDSSETEEELGEEELSVLSETVLAQNLSDTEDQQIYVYLIKWQGYAHCHSTWELEEYIEHLSSFAKVRAYKKKYERIQSFLGNRDIDEATKEEVKEQIRSQKLQIHSFMVPERILGFRDNAEASAAYNRKLEEILTYMRTDKELNLRYSQAFAGSFIKGIPDGSLHYYPQFEWNQYSTTLVTELNFNDPELYHNTHLDEDGYLALLSGKDSDPTNGSRRVMSSITRLSNRTFMVKWRDLPYSKATAEYGEDLVAHPCVGQELFAKLVGEFKCRSLSIKTALKNKKHVRFNQRPSYTPAELDQLLSSPHPSFFVNVSDHLQLREHQIEGVRFLLRRWLEHKSAILADDLGLGKTIQTIAFISALYYSFHVPGPFLIIVPVSILDAWQTALSDWCPSLTVVTLIGTKEDRDVIIDTELFLDPSALLDSEDSDDTREQLKGVSVVPRFHILLTTPQIAVRHEDLLMTFSWRLFIIDEAHSLKNSATHRVATFSKFVTDSKLLITGTPIQNSIDELFNLLNFVEPETFNSLEEFARTGAKDVQAFKEAFTSLGEAGNNEDLLSDQSRVDSIRNAIKPYILRRVKSAVERSIPPKFDFILRMEMTPQQARYTHWVLEQNYTMLTSRVGTTVKLQNLLMQLRKICNHPYLLHDLELQTASLTDILAGSGKFQVLDRVLERMQRDGHRVLIFSQLIKTLDLIERYCLLKKFTYQRMHGSMTMEQRRRAINAFNERGSQDFIFLLSTRSGGQGINLTTADRVIIFDADYNPQNDLQAAGRAHRIGQSNPVVVYRLITKGSVEERILEIGHKKLLLDYAIIQKEGKTAEDESLSEPVLKTQSRDIDDSQEALPIVDNISSVINEEGEMLKTDTLSTVTLDRARTGTTIGENGEHFLRQTVRFGAERLFGMSMTANTTVTNIPTDSMDVEYVLDQAEALSKGPPTHSVHIADVTIMNPSKLPTLEAPISTLASKEEPLADEDFWSNLMQMEPLGLESPLMPDTKGIPDVSLASFPFLQRRDVQRIIRFIRRFGTLTPNHIARLFASDPELAELVGSEVNMRQLCMNILELCKQCCVRHNIDPLHASRTSAATIPFMSVTLPSIDICRAHYTMLLLESIVKDEDFRLPKSLCPAPPTWASEYPDIIDTKLLRLMIIDGFVSSERDLTLNQVDEIISAPGLILVGEPPQGAILSRMKVLARAILRIPSLSVYRTLHDDFVRFDLDPDLTILEDPTFFAYYEHIDGWKDGWESYRDAIQDLIIKISRPRGLQLALATDVDYFPDYAAGVVTPHQRIRKRIPTEVLTRLDKNDVRSMTQSALQSFATRIKMNRMLLDSCHKIPRQRKAFRTCLNIVKKHITGERRRRMIPLVGKVLDMLGANRTYLMGIKIPFHNAVANVDLYRTSLQEGTLNSTSPINRYITQYQCKSQNQGQSQGGWIYGSEEEQVMYQASRYGSSGLADRVRTTTKKALGEMAPRSDHTRLISADFLVVYTTVLDILAARNCELIKSGHEYLEDNEIAYQPMSETADDAVYLISGQYENDLGNFLVRNIINLMFPSRQEPACVLWYICQAIVEDSTFPYVDRTGFEVVRASWNISTEAVQSPTSLSSIEYVATLQLTISPENNRKYLQHLENRRNGGSERRELHADRSYHNEASGSTESEPTYIDTIDTEQTDPQATDSSES